MKDFDYFVDRNMGGGLPNILGNSPTDQVWNKQLMALKGDDWRNVRATFTPIFTSGKMKTMMTFMNVTSEEVAAAFAKASQSRLEVNLKDVCGSFSMETIASCVFGVKAGSFDKSSDSKFIRYAHSLFIFSAWESLMAMLYMTPLKPVIDFLQLPIMRPNETRFFEEVIKGTLRNRRETGTRRGDLIDLMNDALKKDLADGDDASSSDEEDAAVQQNGWQSSTARVLDEDDIVSSALLLLVAGYDTTGNTLCFLLLELAKRPEIQDRLRAEVDEAYESGTDKQGRLTYSAVMGLDYLDMVIHECMRMYPAAATAIKRICVRDYKLPGTDLVIKEGTEIDVPTFGIHMDEQYYPDPERFDPERFSREARAARHPMAFSNFGQGPRTCIGARFAMLEIKVAVAKLVREFVLKTSPGTPDKIELVTTAFTYTPKTPMLIEVEKRIL